MTTSEPKPAAAWVGQLTLLVLVLIVAMVNYLAFRHYQRFDLTDAGIYSLSGKSKQVLDELTADIDVYVFLSRGESSFGQVDELLKRYQAASSHVHVRFVDPEREPAEYQLLAQRFDVAVDGTTPGAALAEVAAVIARGERHWHITRDDLVGFDFGPMPGEDRVQVNVKAEQAVTGGLLQVLHGKPAQLCVAQGHGEWSMDEQEARSLAPLQEYLRYDNLIFEPLQTLGKARLPAECDALLVLGPMRAWADSEVQAMAHYLRHGGNVLLALDPVLERDKPLPTGFEALLAEYGVGLDPTLVVEANPDFVLGQNPAEFLVMNYGQHPITRPLQGRGPVLLGLARSLSVAVDGDGQTGSASAAPVQVLMQTSEQAYGETDLAGLGPDQNLTPDSEDITGPLPVAVALTIPQEQTPDPEAATGGRLLVIGDSDFVLARLLGAWELANGDLISGMIGYLTERRALIAIAPKEVKGGQLLLSQADLAGLQLRVLVWMPGVALLLGVGVWRRRRV